jgi:CubicO group peptidase (beta-lactamase class C family)
MFKKLEEFLDSFLDMGIPGYDISVYHKGSCVFRRMGGYDDISAKTPISGKELYYIYSCSKPITVTAAMMLWERGLFSLDDKLSKYLPEFENMTVKCEGGVRPAEKDITLKQLFTMTAGFNYALCSPSLMKCREETDGRCPTREAMKYLALEPLDFEPGTYYQYSLCHDVLAAVVEVISGQRFGEFVKKNIFIPCGMADSTFFPSEFKLDKIATQYRWHASENELRVIPNDNEFVIGSEYESGGAGCVSTVEDYIKFLEALRIGDVILKKETIAIMATDYLTDKQRAMYSYGTDKIGYGLGMRAPRNQPDHTEFGWAGAAGAYACVDPVNNITLYYAQHVLKPPNRPLRPWLYTAVRADLLGEKIKIPIEQLDDNPNLTY